MSVSVRLSREISVTISVSPGFIRLSAKFAVALALTAADHLRDPAVDYEILTVGETPDFILLVSQILLARTNPEISYNHYSEKLSEGDVAFIRKK